jgi:hypothetical protein
MPSRYRIIMLLTLFSGCGDESFSSSASLITPFCNESISNRTLCKGTYRTYRHPYQLSSLHLFFFFLCAENAGSAKARVLLGKPGTYLYLYGHVRRVVQKMTECKQGHQAARTSTSRFSSSIPAISIVLRLFSL